ncbi:hypothetical protein D3C80_1776870 [compost metagenome]
MDYRSDKLQFLAHPFTQVFYLFVPPAAHLQALDPVTGTFYGLVFIQAFQLCQVEDVLPHFHLFI